MTMRNKSVFKEAAEVGAEKLLEYFRAPKDERDSEAAAFGLKAGANFSRLYAAETNRLATEASTARMIGLSGEALIPLFEEISGRDVRQFLPAPRERSNAPATRRAKNRALADSRSARGRQRSQGRSQVAESTG